MSERKRCLCVLFKKHILVIPNTPYTKYIYITVVIFVDSSNTFCPIIT